MTAGIAGSELGMIVGLGNPGAEYERTRHNAGFWFVDDVAAAYGASFRVESKFLGETARVRIGTADVLLLKPSTFMNRSGQSAQALAAFYKLEPTDLLIAHDELDLAAGVSRLKVSGGHGGHNGLRDVIAHIGPEFWRLRLGVGHPGSKDLVLDAVLDRPTQAEQQAIDAAMERALDIVPELLNSGAQKAMLSLHSRNADDPGTDRE